MNKLIMAVAVLVGATLVKADVDILRLAEQQNKAISEGRWAEAFCDSAKSIEYYIKNVASGGPEDIVVGNTVCFAGECLDAFFCSRNQYGNSNLKAEQDVLKMCVGLCNAKIKEGCAVRVEVLLSRLNAGELNGISFTANDIQSSNGIRAYIMEPIYEASSERYRKYSAALNWLGAYADASTAVYRKQGELYATQAKFNARREYENKYHSTFDPKDRPSESSGRREDWDSCKKIYDIFGQGRSDVPMQSTGWEKECSKVTERAGNAELSTQNVSKPIDQGESCSFCEGRGWNEKSCISCVIVKATNPGGVCCECGNTGKIKEKCEKCNGSGRIRRKDVGTGTYSAEAGAEKVITLPGGEKMAMIYCPPGTFTMGRRASEDGYVDEVLHKVTLTKGFWIGKYEVTQQQWKSVMRDEAVFVYPSFEGDDLPIEGVTWNQCQMFVQKVNAETKYVCALPTEAQWEYACRAGTSTPFHFGCSLNGNEANCWGEKPYGTNVKGKFVNKTLSGGHYSPNAWGIFDMHGNVREWCRDWCDRKWYSDQPVTDPAGPMTGSAKVIKGGCFASEPYDCRSACRESANPDKKPAFTGFRLCVLGGI